MIALRIALQAILAPLGRPSLWLGGWRPLVSQLLNGPIEVARWLLGFQLPALLLVQGKLGVRVVFGQFVRNATSVREYFAIAQPQEIVELGNPIGHVHGSMAAGLEFRKVEIGRHNQVQAFTGRK